ncbi:MAG: GMC family oxidoreductase [Solirubrobacteraceae bacterium]|nr:GMC family oxidoreductase [Solirubrobacteraceae bacterium]
MTTGMTRRRFVGGAMAVGGAAMVPGVARAANPPVREERRQAVVIGSGFGGAVTALRLGQAGVQTVLLERGQRWASGGLNTFPSGLQVDRRTAWMGTSPQFSFFVPNPSGRYAGLMERIPNHDLAIECAAGLGGGSLMYQGVSITPNEQLFDQVMPAGLSFSEFDQTWWPRVRAMLKLQEILADVLASPSYGGARMFMDFVARAGLTPATPVAQTIDWEQACRELRGETARKFITNGDNVRGLNGPGRQSLDTNYLPAAASTGNVEIRTLHWVRGVRRATGAGRWIVDIDKIDPRGRVLERIELTADAVFLCAGTGNTNRLLLRAKATGALPDLPDTMGEQFADNGDLSTFNTIDRPTARGQGGPVPVGCLDWDHEDGPVTMLWTNFPFGKLGLEANQMGITAVTLPSGYGKFTWDTGADKMRLSYPVEVRREANDRARRRINQVIREGRGQMLNLTKADPATYHALGGAVINHATDGYGRVPDHPGLYVGDGALIPGSTGCCNPSVTIAALAERNTEKVLAEDLGSVF